MTYCGIDFGTSNSSVAVSQQGVVNLVPVEINQIIIPSAIFYQRKTNEPFYGREAINRFFTHAEGRFMRSLKRVLGTSVMQYGTSVNGKVMKFDHIIASFLKHLKTKAELHAGTDLHHVVMGRPVHFVDNNTAGDTRAQNELLSIAQKIGFKHIVFQFEPIAAAYAHEVNLQTRNIGTCCRSRGRHV